MRDGADVTAETPGSAEDVVRMPAPAWLWDRLTCAITPVALGREQKRRLFRQQAERLLSFYRIIGLIGAHIFLAFIAQDWVRGGRDGMLEVLPLRLAVYAFLVLCWVLSFRPWYARNWFLVWPFQIVIVNVAIVATSAVIGGGFAYATTGILFALSANIVLSPNLLFAVASYSFGAGGSILALVAFGATGRDLSSAVAYLVAFAILFIIVSLSAEQSRRRGFQLADRLALERARVDALIEAMMPETVAERLTAGHAQVAEQVPQASVAFIDVVGYSSLVRTIPAERLVAFLAGAFDVLDGIVRRHGLTKIKTNGDSYMAAAGVHESEGRGAGDAVAFALDAIAAIRTYGSQSGFDVAGHAGIATGPVVAGVIGRTRPQYDLWGQTVNIASRLQDAAEADELLTDRTTAVAVAGRFRTEERGPTLLQGVGTVDVWRIGAG
jgi:class 3 adenylate cyclase